VALACSQQQQSTVVDSVTTHLTGLTFPTPSASARLRLRFSRTSGSCRHRRRRELLWAQTMPYVVTWPTAVSLDPVRVKCLLRSPPLDVASPLLPLPDLPSRPRCCQWLHHRCAERNGTPTTTRSSVTTHTSLTDLVPGEVVRISHPAWTGAPAPPILSRISPSQPVSQPSKVAAPVPHALRSTGLATGTSTH